MLAWFGAGVAVSSASFLSYRLLAAHGPLSPQDETILATFLSLWDFHRAPLAWKGAAVAAVVTSTLLALVEWRRSPTLLVALGASAVLAAAATLAFGLARSAGVPLPTFAEMLMPARYLDLTLLAAQPLVMGLLLRHADRPVHALTLAAYVALVWLSLVTRGTAYEVTAAFALVAAILRRVPEGSARPALLVLPAVVSLIAWRPIGKATWHALDDPPPATLFATILEPDSETIVPESDLHLVQLHTRQRILLDGGALDQLPYAPEIGPDLVAILRDVYGVDFDHPPELHTAKIPQEPARTVWANRTRMEWSLLAHRYGFTKVLTRQSLALDLDPVAAEAGLVLWTVQ